MTLSEYLAHRIGKNWVIARRTSRIVERYGDTVRCLSSAAYQKIEQEYRREYGSPRDPGRAELYVAAKLALGNFAEYLADRGIDDPSKVRSWARLDAALKNEANARS